MKKALNALAALLLLAASPAAAQERQLGLKGGASLSTLNRERTLTGDEPFGIRAGMTIGPYLVLPLSNRVAVQLEMLFTEKGGSLRLIDPSIVQGTVSTRYKFQYLDVPALARIRGPRVMSATLFGFAGPTLSLRMDARQQLAFSDVGAFGFERDLANEMKRLDLGVTLGGGAQVGRLVVDLRYTHGLSNVVDEDNGTALANRGFLVTAGFRIF